jgi:Outer membrane lipoprotein-sorting protein
MIEAPGVIRASLALLLVLSLAYSAGAQAASADQDTVVNGSRQRIEKLDYRASGRLTKVGADGKRTNYKFAAKAHWFPDGLRLLFVVTGTANEKTSLLLHMSANGRLTIDTILPGAKTSSALPVEHWGDPLVGTDFSYEDLVESQFFWKGQELQASAKYGARDCFVLKSTSSAQDRTSYSSVTSWIDRSILFPVQELKTVRGSGQQKQFVSFGLRQNGGVWSASQIEAKVQGKPGSSLLVIEGGTPKANLTLKDFNIAQTSDPQPDAK